MNFPNVAIQKLQDNKSLYGGPYQQNFKDKTAALGLGGTNWN